MPLHSPCLKHAVTLSGALAVALTLIPVGHSQTATTPAPSPPVVQSLTLDAAKQGVVANSKLLTLAATNVEGKGFATKALRAQYFPQVIGTSVYFHFNDDLGTVITTPGRHVIGPRGRPIVGIPSLTIDAAVLNQDTSFSTIAAVQPLTALLKVRAGVKAARADEEIAQAQLDKGRRELLSGTEQLFWGPRSASAPVRGRRPAGPRCWPKTRPRRSRCAWRWPRPGRACSRSTTSSPTFRSR
jgi:outer membrane protein TolC